MIWPTWPRVQNTLINVALTLIVGFSCLAFYWLVLDLDQPFEEIGTPIFHRVGEPNEPKPVEVRAWPAGSRAAVWRHFCYHRQVSGMVYRSFGNSLEYRLGETRALSELKVGCYARSFPTYIPEDLPPGPYLFRVWVANARVNPLKTVSYALREVPILVLTKEPRPQ